MTMLVTRKRFRPPALPATRHEKRVHDVMTSFVVTVSSEASLARAARLMNQYHITGLPAVDADGRVVGVISQTDLLREAMDDRPGPQSWRYRKVADAMTRPALTIGEGASAEAARRGMARQRVHRLIVLDNFGRARGIVTHSNL
jgi:CBS domain-containing protein